MAADRGAYRTRPDVEARFVRIELAERRLELICRGVVLVLIVALVVTVIICALGGAWPIGAAAGALLTAIVRTGAGH